MSETPSDTQRLDWLEANPDVYGRMQTETGAWVWCADDECEEVFVSIRAAIDAAISASLAPLSEPTSEGT